MNACLVIAILALLAAPAFADTGSTGSVTLANGPHAGQFSYTSDDACIIAALPGRPTGFSLFLLGEKSSLTLDVPDITKTSQIQMELVVADVKPGQSRKTTASVNYTVDTRPDTALEAYQKAERAGMSGQGGFKLVQQTTAARLTFTGTTASGVKITGTVDCRKIDREYGR